MTAKEMWEKSGLKGSYDAWSFGGEPDLLADLVLKGIKTSTCSALIFYEIENAELPEVGEYNIILDSKDNAICITKTTKVYITKYNEVSKEHVYKEGEGDRSLSYWHKVHEEFFTEELSSIGKKFDLEMELVCEEFEVVFK